MWPEDIIVRDGIVHLWISADEPLEKRQALRRGGKDPRGPGALHEKLFVLTVTTQSVPWTKDAERLSFEEIAPRFWRAAARYGFMERPDIPALLQRAHGLGCAIDLSDITYYVGHETVVPDEADKALPRVVEALFAFMQRNSAHLTEYLRLPMDAVVEIGRQVSI